MVSNELILKFEHKIESKNMKFSRGSNDEIETLSNETCRPHRKEEGLSSQVLPLVHSLQLPLLNLDGAVLLDPGRHKEECVEETGDETA